MKGTLRRFVVQLLSRDKKNHLPKINHPINKKGVFVILLSMGLFLSNLAFTGIRPHVVYGNDDRIDVYQTEDKNLIRVAQSTVALLNSSNLKFREDGSAQILSDIYGDSYNLCSDEPFNKQPNPAFCSGFLVADDMIATAGHCIKSTEDCSDTFFLFDYKMEDSEHAPVSLQQNQIYRCQSIVKQEYTGKQDYALVKLDRPVVGRDPLHLAIRPVEKNDMLMVIGHPAGLPTKIAGGAIVRNVTPEFFVANLDTYGGNSGSAVFDSHSLDVVGILVRGERDFATDQNLGCRRSNVCESGGCRGEDVTQISFISKLIDP